jgi:hypothetical protein
MASLLFKNLFSGSKPENGELTINLNLTIKIEADGSLSVVPTAEKTAAVQEPWPAVPTKKLPEKNDALIPDFDFGGENSIIDFGKNV